MNKYVNIEVAKEYLRHDSFSNPYFRSQACQQAMDVLDTVPIADVVEVRHGRWIWLEEDEDDFETDIVECSYCGKSYATLFSKESFFETFKFCHNCGTKMDGGQNE